LNILVKFDTVVRCWQTWTSPTWSC